MEGCHSVSVRNNDSAKLELNDRGVSFETERTRLKEENMGRLHGDSSTSTGKTIFHFLH